MKNEILSLDTTAQELISNFNKNVPAIKETSDISLYGRYEIHSIEEGKMYYKQIHDCLSVLVYAFSTCDNKGDMVPAHPYQFYTQLKKIIFENRIPIERVRAAANHLMMNHRYFKFTIADFINFDVKVKTFTKNEVYQNCGQYPSSLYPLVRFPDGREAYVSFSSYNEHKLDSNIESKVRNGEIPLVKALLMIDDFKRYDVV